MNNQGVSILVVDDEFSVRDSLYNWFKTEGYRTDTAENGMEALKKLQESPWDIVLVDIKMPGMDGMELQRHIKKIDNTIIVIIDHCLCHRGHGSGGDERRGLRLSFQTHRSG